LKIESALAAHSDASVKGIVRHATNAAGFGEPITKEAEVSPHPAEMETTASDATANLVRMPRPDREAARAKPKTAPEKKQRSLYPVAQPEIACGGRVQVIGIARTKEQQSPRQKHPLVLEQNGDRHDRQTHTRAHV
jgi:hypothetical protein